MNYNLKRHKLLQELTRLITNREENRNDFDCNEVSMTFKQIDKFLNVTRQEREIILSELWSSNEIILCEFPNNYKGCFINDPIGISSFSNKKYLKWKNFYLRKTAKTIFGIILFIITVITFYFTVIIPNDLIPYTKRKTQESVKDTTTQFQSKKELNTNLEIHKTE